MRSKAHRQGFKASLAVLALAVPIFAIASSVLAQCPSYVENFDGVTPPALPAGWTASQGVNVTGAPLWVTSAFTPHTAPNDAFTTAPDNILDNRLDTPLLMASIFDPQIFFQNNYNLESGRDGAVLEISSPNINGGAFTDITDPAVGGSINPGYNSVISSAFQSPLAGRMAWSGNSGGYVSTSAFFGKAAFPLAHSVKVRFRLVSDNSGASEGWRVDTVSVPHNECGSPPPPISSPTPSPTVTPSVTPTPTIVPTATPTPTASSTPTPIPAQALNISTRLRVETGDRIAIGGFIITGSEPKKVAIRGIGPSLSSFGLSDLLADPTIELRDTVGVLISQNDDWQDDLAQAAQLIALGLAPQDPKESGMVATLEPGRFTVLLAGNNQTSGIGVVEIYDADPTASSQLANISTRGFVRTGDNVMIGGFILGNGSGNADVVVRALGPSLSRFMLMDVVQDPTLELRDANGALLVANDDWQDDPDSAAQLIARDLWLTHAVESGIFASLPPGTFTAIMAGKNGDVGIGLVEVYNVPTLVTNTADSGPGSLRDAIAAARDGDTIQFDAALDGQVIVLTSGELLIDKSLTIRGPGSNDLTVQRSTASGTGAFRIFHVAPGHTVRIEGLTISKGNATLGSGILNDHATLTIENCAMQQNGGQFDFGGGVYNDGSGSSATATILNSTISGNGAFYAGGGLYNDASDGGNAILTIINSIVTQNVAGNTIQFGSGSGGGIHNEGFDGSATVTITNSLVSNNRCGGNAAFPFGYGGGIGNFGELTITNSTISGNTTGREGGGIYNLGSLTIVSSTISGNIAEGLHDAERWGYGGGISNHGLMTFTNSTLSNNYATNSGGGIYGGGDFRNSTIGNNTATEQGGGIAASRDVQIGNTILKAGLSGATISNNGGTVTSHGYSLSSDDGGGFLTATGDQINTDPMLGPLQNNGGSTFTHALLAGSPALDAGDPNFAPPPLHDQRGPGYDRVENGRIDIGSFELQP